MESSLFKKVQQNTEQTAKKKAEPALAKRIDSKLKQNKGVSGLSKKLKEERNPFTLSARGYFASPLLFEVSTLVAILIGLQMEFSGGLSFTTDGFFARVAKILTPVLCVLLLKIFTGLHLRTNAIDIAEESEIIEAANTKIEESFDGLLLGMKEVDETSRKVATKGKEVSQEHNEMKKRKKELQALNMGVMAGSTPKPFGELVSAFKKLTPFLAQPESYALMVATSTMKGSPPMAPMLSLLFSLIKSKPTLNEKNGQVLGTIVRVATALNLTIDWQKTWGWATSPEHKETLHHVQQQLSPQANPLQMVTHARELGYILHYKCNPSRASHKVRHQEVLVRLKKLQKQDLPLDTKAQIARASCLMKAFFGAELYATGERFFTEVRTGIARALLGDQHNIQTHVACACLSKFVEDPELFVIKQAIKKARNYLQQVGSDEFAKFMKVVTQFRHRPSQIIGPAAALQLYLSKIGIQHGQLSIGAFFTLHLCDSNLEDIFMAVDEAWMENVSMALHTRKGCQFTPQIDHVLTAKIFASLPEEQQVTVGLDIVGGFMTNGQKQHFTDMDDKCQFCGQSDSVEHRVMQCTATQCIRSNYPDVVEFLQSHDHIHLLVPVIFRSPQWEFDRQIRFQMTHQLEKEPDLQLSRVFTDGSSLLPTDVRYRWATFAIVTQIVPDDELITMVNLSPVELLEQAFTILDVGLCPGTPTVPRSELLAAVLSHEMAPNAQVVTDSAYVISCFQHVKQSPRWQLLHEHKNFDLLKRWWFSIHQSGGIPTGLKVKAHAEISPKHFHQAILQIGNRAADSAAKTAAKHLSKAYTSYLQAEAKTNKLQMELLRKEFQMISIGATSHAFAKTSQ